MLSMYVIAYDTPCSRRRRRLVSLLSRRGRRVQRSVFELLADPASLARCLKALEKVIAPEDSVLVYSASGARFQLGLAPEALARPVVSLI